MVGAAFLISLALALVVALIFEAVELVGAPLLVAIILAATSFGIVVAVLKDAGQTGTPFGQLVIAGASIADFSTVILLSLFFSSSGASFETTLVLLLLFLGRGRRGRPGARGRARLGSSCKATVARLHRTSAQISVRIAFLLLAVLVYMSEEFGLEVVLGAFLAGAMVSLLDREHAVRATGLQDKLEGIGFGVFIPIFFVVSGVKLDLDSLFASLDTLVLVPLTVIALLVVRGLPALIYRRFVAAPRGALRRPAAGDLAVVRRRRHPDRRGARQARLGGGRRAGHRRGDLGAAVPGAGAQAAAGRRAGLAAARAPARPPAPGGRCRPARGRCRASNGAPSGDDAVRGDRVDARPGASSRGPGHEQPGLLRHRPRSGRRRACASARPGARRPAPRRRRRR